jgi:Flp pilus assembly protein TadD/predicted NAD-dependent protein-ADP-ribosyltransferase YbiA (DUF1768 family)
MGHGVVSTVLLLCAAYPAHWWAPVPEDQKASWEILPQAAKPGQVILSKRNELGILSNFAATPFTFRGKRYASVEGFWQMMLYPEGPDDPREKAPGIAWPHTRSEVAQMIAFEAKDAGTGAEENMRKMGIGWVTFEGRRMEYRSPRKGAHYDLIVAAMRAKLEQNPKVREILLATGDLTLLPDHIEEADAPPEWRYYQIWMEIRAELQSAATADTPEIHLGKGYDALKQGRYDEAESEFRAALRLDPTLVMRARFPLAVALFEAKQSDEARQEFEAVHRQAGDQPSVLYYLGRLDLQDRNFEGAIRNLSQAVVKPPFPDTAYHLGFAYLRQGNLEAAEKWLKAASGANPHDSAVPYQLALLYRKQGREEEAQKAFALSAQLRRRDTDDSQLQGECAQKLDQGPRDEAREVCQRLYDPNDPAKLAALGLLYGQHGDPEDALDPLRRAAALAPQSPQMQYNLAYTYYRLNRFAEARTPIADAVQRWPDLFQLSALYGAVLAKLGEDLAAYPVLRRAHELNPQDARVADLLFATTLGLARKSLTARQFTDSLRYFDEAATLRPADPAPHLGKAEAWDLMGRQEEAAAERQQAARLGPGP